VIDLPAGRSAASGVALALVPCPACGADDAEPIAVGQDFEYGTMPDSLLGVRCRVCELVYLNPAPVPDARDRLYPAAYFTGADHARDRRRAGRAAARAAVARCRRLPASARVLELAYGDSLHVEMLRRMGPPTWNLAALTPHAALAAVARERGIETCVGFATDLPERGAAYDCILMLHALEHCVSPLEELLCLRRRLAPGGRIVIVAQNAESTVGRTFQGRHWAGYDFPRHRVIFGPSSLRRLADKAGYEVERLDGVRFSRTWDRSADHFLSDWRAPSWLRGRRLMSAGLAAAAETAVGRGIWAAWMAGVLLPRPGTSR